MVYQGLRRVGMPLLGLLLATGSGGQPLMRSAPLAYQPCQPEPLVVEEQDSVRQRAVLDSISILFSGRWELAEEGAGDCFVAAHAPTQYTEMILTRQGQGVVYVAGKQITTFRLLLTFYWGSPRFAMNETSPKPYFDFLPPYKSRRKHPYDPTFEGRYVNLLRVCAETLRMTGPRTGLSYVFRRLPAKDGPKQ